MTKVLSSKFIQFIFVFIIFESVSQKLFSQSSVTFSYTGAMQTYIVPAGINSLRVDASGAQGGVGSYGPGGLGGRVSCTLSVVPGNTLNIFVGQMPTTLVGGYNGGGTAASGYGAAAGGGATDIRIGGTSLTDRVLVAGGGGGSGYGLPGGGGGLVAAPGGTAGYGIPATGGTQSAGGLGGIFTGGNCGVGFYANNGTLGIGGDGVIGDSYCNWFGGPGGGGGYYGGGGMQISAAAGGSSYSDGNATNVTHTQGYKTGNGQITLVPIFDVVITHTNVNCYGLANGSAIAAVSSGSGVGPYTYKWLPSGGTSSIATGLSPGTYTCVVSTTAYTTEAITTITEPGVFSVSISSQTNVTCFNGANGAVSLNVTGGTAPYSYTWTPAVSSTSIVTALIAGTYTAFISELNSCGMLQQIVTITQQPTFAISASASSQSICNGGSVILSGSGATSYSWTGGVTDGVSFPPSITTSYSVTGINSFGCLSSNISIVTVTVYNLPTVTVNSGTICAGQTFSLIAGGASTYSYSGGSATVSPINSASYSVTGISPEGCLSFNTAVSTITVYALPILSVNNGTVCSGQSFTMNPSGAVNYSFTGGSAIVSPTANTTYSVTGSSTMGCVSAFAAVSDVTVIASPSVSVNSGSICEGQSFTLTPTGAVTYSYSSGSSVVSPSLTLTYTITGANVTGACLSNPAISTVTVYPLPVISVSHGTICLGESFTIAPSGASTYSISGGNVIVNPLSNSSYTIIGFSGQGCASLNTLVATVQVEALPTLTLSGANEVCLGNSITELLNTSAISYTWSNGSTSNMVILNPTVSSLCSVTVTGTNACTNTSSKLITVNPLPIVIAITTSSLICTLETATLIASGATTYSWSDGSNGANSVVNPFISTSYTVIGTDAESCQNTAVVVQLVDECLGINKTVNEITQVVVYPNPNDGEFTLELKTFTGKETIEIYNSLGELVLSRRPSSMNTFVDIKHLRNGIYIIIMKEGGHNKGQFKLIKE